MTEAVVATEVSETVLAANLKAAGLNSPLVLYLGALSPQHLDAPERETAALLSGVACHDLGWLRRIAVRGEDRFRWLSGMVTNAVETLGDSRKLETGAYNLVLNAQGRIQGDCYVWRRGDALEVEVTAAQAEALMAHFDRFIIMDDVELALVESVVALGLTGPAVDGVLRALGLPVLDEPLMGVETGLVLHGGEFPARLRRGYGESVAHYSVWVTEDRVAAVWAALIGAGAVPVGTAALEQLRVVEGVPRYGVDIQSRDLAQETSQERALCFTKGCYLGQEIVERIRSRGQVHRHLRSLELVPDEEGTDRGDSTTLPVAGIELRCAGSEKPGAVVTSSARVGGRIFAIGMVRAEAEVAGRAGELDLVYDGGKARILKAPVSILEFQDGSTRAAEETV